MRPKIKDNNMRVYLDESVNLKVFLCVCYQRTFNSSEIKGTVSREKWTIRTIDLEYPREEEKSNVV